MLGSAEHCGQRIQRIAIAGRGGVVTGVGGRQPEVGQRQRLGVAVAVGRGDAPRQVAPDARPIEVAADHQDHPARPWAAAVAVVAPNESARSNASRQRRSACARSPRSQPKFAAIPSSRTRRGSFTCATALQRLADHADEIDEEPIVGVVGEDDRQADQLVAALVVAEPGVGGPEVREMVSKRRRAAPCSGVVSAANNASASRTAQRHDAPPTRRRGRHS